MANTTNVTSQPFEHAERVEHNRTTIQNSGGGRTGGQILAMCMLMSFRMVPVVLTILFNVLLLKIVSRIKRKELKFKLLLMNDLISGILFQSIMAVDVLDSSVISVFPIDQYIGQCLQDTAEFMKPVAQYGQALSAVLLALDRAYVVFLPLNYHVHAYSSFASFCIIFTNYLLVLLLSIPVFLVSQDGVGTTFGFCSQLNDGHRYWTFVVRFPLVIGISGTVFVVYAGLLVFTKCATKTQITLRKSMKTETFKLALTFLYLHLSTLMLYIPGPIISLLIKSKLLDRNVGIFLRPSLVLLYLFNPILRSVIMANKIPQIRTALTDMWRKKPLSRARNRQSGEKPEVLTVS